MTGPDTVTAIVAAETPIVMNVYPDGPECERAAALKTRKENVPRLIVGAPPEIRDLQWSTRCENPMTGGGFGRISDCDRCGAGPGSSTVDR